MASPHQDLVFGRIRSTAYSIRKIGACEHLSGSIPASSKVTSAAAEPWAHQVPVKHPSPKHSKNRYASTNPEETALEYVRGKTNVVSSPILCLRQQTGSGVYHSLKKPVSEGSV